MCSLFMRTAAVCCEEPQSSPIVIPFGIGHHWLVARGRVARHRRADAVPRKVQQKVCIVFWAWRPPLLRAGYGRLNLFPLPSTPRSAILSIDLDAIGRGGKRSGLAASVGLYHWLGGRRPTGRATVIRLDLHDDRYEGIIVHIRQGCGGSLSSAPSRFRAVGTHPSRFDFLS